MTNEITLYEHQQIIVDRGQDFLRIDKYLFHKLPNVTRNKIQQGIKKGYVFVNNNPVKSNYRVHAEDIISIHFPELPRNNEIKPENIPLDIVHEDEDILIINKPAGMVVHPAHQNWTGTLVNALVYRFEKLPEMKGNTGRPGLVHRIDKNTSGLLIITKTERALQALSKQFYDHSIQRTYYTLIWGIPEQQEGTIDINVGRSYKDRRITQTFLDKNLGKRAVTHYEVLENLRYVALLKCNLETGRTHQIRAHLKHLGHPLFNDQTYGGNRILKGSIFTKYKQFVQNCFDIIPRQALHAKTLGFIHPANQKPFFIDSELPTDFDNVLKKWRNYVNFS